MNLPPTYVSSLLLGTSLLLGIAPGCRPQTPTALPPTAPQQRAKYANLEGLKRSQQPELKAELERLTAEGVTPLQLEQREPLPGPGGVQAASASSAASGESAAVRLARTFPAFTRNALREQLAAVYPARQFTWGPAELAKARDIRVRYEAARRKFREELRSAADDGLGLDLSAGPLIDPGFLDAIAIGCRLEGILAAEALAEDRADEASNSVGHMLRAANVLGCQFHLASRLAAVTLRAEALHALSAVLNHSSATTELQQQAYNQLLATVASWPREEQAWIGDRVSGLITYELVRDGYFLSLLASDEIEELKGKEILLVTARTARHEIDSDEAFYLRAVRQLIDDCRLPFYERRRQLLYLRQELDDLRDTPGYPLTAGTLLLVDFERAMERQAEDLARIRAWIIGLAAVLGEAPIGSEINALTGLPYRVEATTDGVQVTGILTPEDEPLVLIQHAAHRAAERPIRTRY